MKLKRIAIVCFLLMLSCSTLSRGQDSAAPTPPAAPNDTAAPQPAEEPKQLSIVPDVNRLVWTIVIFLILLAILYPTAWKNVLEGLKKREERIRKDIEDAESARNKATATLREYTNQLATAEQQVRDLLSKAAAEGEKIAAGIRLHAQQEAQEIKERAVRDIDTAKDQAIREVYAQTAELATSVAEKILRRSLNVDDQRDLVSRSLDQLQSAHGN